MDKVLFIDGMNAIHRASISFSNAHTVCDQECEHPSKEIHCSCGKPWVLEKHRCSYMVDEEFVIVYNFFRNLRPIIELFAPQKLYLVLEGHPKFRYDLFPEYKQNRIVKISEEVKNTRKENVHKAATEITRLFAYLKATVVKAEYYEADDVIGSLCENLKDEELTILSSDTDFTQLLQKNYKSIQVYNPIRKKFIEKPDYPYVYWKSLVGDTSDNIPGFSGIGKVTAQKMLKSPEKLKKFFEIEENKANFNIYRELIEFKKVPEEDLIITEGSNDFVKLKEEFNKMKFESITNDSSWEKFTKTFKTLTL